MWLFFLLFPKEQTMIINYRVILALQAFLLFFVIGPVSAGNLTDDLKGPAFSDPDQTVQKPERWIKSPIRYGKWAKGADVAITLDQRQYYIFQEHIAEYGRKNG